MAVIVSLKISKILITFFFFGLFFSSFGKHDHGLVNKTLSSFGTLSQIRAYILMLFY